MGAIQMVTRNPDRMKHAVYPCRRGIRKSFASLFDGQVAHGSAN